MTRTNSEWCIEPGIEAAIEAGDAMPGKCIVESKYNVLKFIEYVYTCKDYR